MDVDIRPFASRAKCRLTIGGVTHILEWPEVERLCSMTFAVLTEHARVDAP